MEEDVYLDRRILFSLSRVRKRERERPFAPLAAVAALLSLFLSPVTFVKESRRSRTVTADT